MLSSDMHEVCVFNGDQELVDRSFQLPCADKKRLSVPSLWVIGDKAIANHFFEFFQCKEVHVSDQSQLLSDESGVPFEQVAMCVWLLPTFASFADVDPQDIFRIMSIVAKKSGSICFLSVEDKADSDHSFHLGPSFIGSMLSAQWELEQVPMKLIRIRSPTALSYEQLPSIVGQELSERGGDIQVIFDVAATSWIRSTICLTSLAQNVSTDHALPKKAANQEIYLITGGRGALGLRTAKALMERGVGIIVLISRNGKVAEEDVEFYLKLTSLKVKYNCRIIEVRADVTSVKDMDRAMAIVLKSTKGTQCKLSGIVHAAGTLSDGLLLSGSCSQRANSVWQTKVEGIRTVLAIAKKHGITKVIGYSSIVSTVGNIGQCAYALANKCMEDILIKAKREDSINTCSIRWPGVIGAGMGKTFSVEMSSLMISTAFVETLVRFCYQNDWKEEILSVIPTGLHIRLQHSILRNQLSVHYSIEDAADVVSSDGSIEEVKGDSPNDNVPTFRQLDSILDVVRNAAAGLLLQSVRENQDHQPLLAMGMDSINAAEFAIELGAHFAIDFPATLIYSYPSIKSIAEFIYKKLGALSSSNQMHPSSESKIGENQDSTDWRAICPFSAKSMPQMVGRHSPVIRPCDDDQVCSSSIGEDHEDFDDVAIIGVSMDFPSNCRSLQDLDRLLISQSNTASEAPWDSKAVTEFLEITDDVIKQRISKGHFLAANQLEFDASSFNISASESDVMHITHKLLLNNCMRALEDCGYVHEKICVNTGVFVGIGGQAEADNTLQNQFNQWNSGKQDDDDIESDEIKQSDTTRSDIQKISAWSATASTTSVAAGRISYTLGLQGPCMAIDTACSSSLVALHAARRSLQMKECDMAIVAGVNVLEVWTSVACAIAGMNSCDGLCRTFDARAAGYARGEGCGVIVLKRKGDAFHDRDPMYAIVKGSSVQQDGKSASLTAPNGLAQQSVIRNALKDAKLKSASLSFFEAHGTGTQYGDPVETAAIVSELKDSRVAEHPLYISAVKANIGHLEAAAGLAGLFSAIISMHKEELPPLCGLQEVNHIVAKSLQGSNICISNQMQPLKRHNQTGQFVAGVSSFGYSGTISHVIIEEPHMSCKKSIAFTSDDSCKVETMMPKMEEIYDSLILDQSIADIPDVPTHELDTSVVVNSNKVSNIIWQFAGQGSLKVGSGKALYYAEEGIRRHLTRCDEIVKKCLGVAVTDLLYPEVNRNISTSEAERKMQQSKYGQAVLVSLEYAQAAALLDQGVQPWVVMGHSLGEYAAIVIAGVLTLEESLTLVCERGSIVEAQSGCCGVMLACRSTEADTLAAIKKMDKKDQEKVSVAGINGKNSIVLAGDKGCLDKLTKLMGLGATIPLGVKHAFHSPLMKAAEQDFQKCLEKVHFQPPTIPFVSTVTGNIVAAEEICSVEYWIKHMMQSVRYVDAIETACQLYLQSHPSDQSRAEEPLTLVELGPQNTLTKLCNPIIKSSGLKTFEALSCVE